MTSSFLNYSAENSLTGTVVPAAKCPSLRCTKKKDEQICQLENGTWSCKPGTAIDTCYEDYESDGDCKPLHYLACASTAGYPDCA